MTFREFIIDVDDQSAVAHMASEYVNSGNTQADQATYWIEVAAYYIWVEEGRPHGRDKEHWEKATQQFLERPDNQ